MKTLTLALLGTTALAVGAWLALAPPDAANAPEERTNITELGSSGSGQNTSANRPGVWGRIHTAAGREASGQRVSLLFLRDQAVLPQQAWRRDGAFAYRVEGRADALGVFHLKQPPRANQLAMLAIEAPDHAPFYLQLGRLDPAKPHDLGEIHLADGARLSGTSIGNDSKSSKGPTRLTLLPSLEVQDLPALPLSAPEGIASLSTTTDDSGRYVLEHAPPGRWALLVEPSGPFAPYVTPYFSLREGEHVTRDVELYVGRHVQGIVRDGDARPVGEAIVHVEPASTDHAHPAIRLETREDGTFETTRVGTPGALRIRVEKVGHRAYERVFERLDAQLRIVLHPELAIEGRVLDARTREPLPDCWLGSFPHTELDDERLESAGILSRQSLPHRTLVDGTFRIEGHVPGTYVILAVHATHLPGRSELISVAEEGLAQPVEILLERGTTLAIDLNDPAGKPVSGALLELRRAPRRDDEPEIIGRYRHPPLGKLLATQTTSGGHAEFERVAVGSYRVHVKRAGSEHELPVAIEVETGVERIEHRIDLTFASRINGVLTLGGEPTERWKLFALHASGEAFEAIPGEEGRYAFPALPGGNYRIVPVPRSRHVAEARWAPFNGEVIEHPEARTVELEPGEHRELLFDLRPEPLARVRGIVKIGNESHRVFFCRPDAPSGTPLIAFPSALTDANGAFELASLPVGTYAVLVARADVSTPREHVLLEKSLVAIEGLNDLGVLATTTFHVRGHIVDAEGQPVGPGELVVSRDGRSTPRRIQVDATGAFELGELPQGAQLTCMIAIPGCEPDRHALLVTPGVEPRFTARRK